MSSISSLVTAARIKSLVKIQVPQPPCGDRAALSTVCAAPAPGRDAVGIQGRRPLVLSPGCWE